MKQTATEWLFTQLYERFEMKGDGKEMNEVLEEAKAMERQHIIDAYESWPISAMTGEQYYSETHKK
jgi:hypothetical protein